MRALFVWMAALALGAAARADNESSARQPAGAEEGGRAAGGWGGGIGSVLWDDGDTNGVNAVSNAHQSVIGSRRTILDDFEVSDAAGWRISGFQWIHIWTNGGGPKGTGVELRFRQNRRNTPGEPITGLMRVTSYDEQATGRIWFNRPEMVSRAEFVPLELAQGRYWAEWNILGPENNFAMVRNINPRLEALWLDYDWGFPQPGRNLFGVDYYLSFMFTGDVIPEPPAVALLGCACLAVIRRR